MLNVDYYKGISNILDIPIELLYLSGLIIVIMLMLIILFTNMVMSVLSMILAFIFIGIFLIMSNIEYIGYVYIVVYVGAIAILFIFVVMMLNLNIVTNILEYRKNQILDFIVILLYLIVIILLIDNIVKNHIIDMWHEENLGWELLEINTIFWDNYVYTSMPIGVIGSNIYINSDVLLIITSLLLLLSLIGAIRITIYKK